MRTAVLALLVACVLALTAPPALADVRRPPPPPPPPPPGPVAVSTVAAGVAASIGIAAAGFWFLRRVRRPELAKG
jgi:hypothetical protein